MAGDPVWEAKENQWRVPILLVPPGLVVGQVGEALVSHPTPEITSHTPLAQIYEATEQLRQQHHDEIEAAFLQARKA